MVLVKYLMAWRCAQSIIKRSIVVRLVWMKIMRVVVSDAVNGGGVVQRLFWDFAGKEIALPQMKENYPGERFVEWHKREVFRGGH